jgi:hypothetical protein
MSTNKGPQVLEFRPDATFILDARPRTAEGNGEVAEGDGSSVVTTYTVMVLGFGRPKRIAIKVPGPPPRVAEGDQLEFVDLVGQLYRSGTDSGALCTRVMFTASGVARAKGRQVPEGAQA